AGKLEVLVNAPFDDHAVELLVEKRGRRIEDTEARYARCPELSTLGDDLRVRVVKADEGELVGMLGRPANDTVGMRVPHSQHAKLERHDLPLHQTWDRQASGRDQPPAFLALVLFTPPPGS